MKTMQYILTCCSLSILLFSCDSFLDENPKGVLSNEQLNTPENVEKMVIAAYSSLGNDHYTEPNSPWPYGDLRSGDAYKGGAGTGICRNSIFTKRLPTSETISVCWIVNGTRNMSPYQGQIMRWPD